MCPGVGSGQEVSDGEHPPRPLTSSYDWITQAVLRRPVESGQYASAAYRALLVAEGMIASMSRKGNCWDNAVAESFFATLEWELIERHRWKTQDEARSAVFEYIETWYNARRRHSSLGYVSPAAYELALRQGAAA